MADDLKAVLKELRALNEGQDALNAGQDEIKAHLVQISEALVYVGERMLNPVHEQPKLRKILGIKSQEGSSGGGGCNPPIPMAAKGHE